MFILNIYGLTERQVLSKKLNISISNLPEEWENEIVMDIQEEIHNRLFTSKRYTKKSLKIEQYDLKEIISSGYFEGIFEEYKTDKLALKDISNKLVHIEAIDSEESFLRLINAALCNPTCEDSFEEKFLNFLHFIGKHNTDRQMASCIYSSNRDFMSKPQIMMRLSADGLRPFEAQKCKEIFETRLANMKMIGEVIDKYLEEDKDFYMLDYLINAIYEDTAYNAFHLFKLISLIEMLLINPKSNGKTKGEIEKKLPYFIATGREFTDEDKKVKFSALIRVIRNKIAHGDFTALAIKLEEYATEFMENFHFDYFEYSRINWIYLSLCCVLEGIVSEIIWTELTRKEDMNILRYS